MMTMGNENDFKFVMQNFSDVFIGLRMTYSELGDAEDTPQKLKTAIYMYIMAEAGGDIRICDHLLTIDEKSKTYDVFARLKGKFKVMIPVQITDRKGNVRTEYRENILTIQQLVGDEELKKQINPDYMMEFRFSKLHLGSLAV